MSIFGEFDTESFDAASFFDDELTLTSGGTTFASRFYFPASEAADVSPAFDISWTDTDDAVRRKLAITKGSSAIAVGSTVSFTQTDFALDRQYVSPPMTAQTILGSTVAKMQLMVREFDAADNVDYVIVSLSVVSNDGTTLKHNLLNFAGYGTVGTEFINNATCRNSICITNSWTFGGNGSSGGGDYVIDDGDRLVLEVGYGLNTSLGTTPQAAAKWGENATDLPEDDSQTTDGAGWLEFSNPVEFQGSAGVTQTGAVSYNISVTQVSAGNRAATGAVAYNISLTEVAAGGLAVAGAVAYNVSLTEVAAGRLIRNGEVAYNISLTETAAGNPIRGGAAAFVISTTQTASGNANRAGAAAFTISLTETAAGDVFVPPPPMVRVRAYTVGSGRPLSQVTGSKQPTFVTIGSETPIVNVTGSSQIRVVVRASGD